MQEALQDILGVHKSDELMFTETVPPYAPLNEVRASMYTPDDIVVLSDIRKLSLINAEYFHVRVPRCTSLGATPVLAMCCGCQWPAWLQAHC